MTFLETEVTEDADPALVGTTPTLIPERALSLRADYTFQGNLDGVSLGLGLRHQGPSFTNTANTLEVDSVTLGDLYGSYEISDEVTADLAITNLTDERYVTGCQSEFVCSYGAGREVSLRATRRW